MSTKKNHRQQLSTMNNNEIIQKLQKNIQRLNQQNRHLNEKFFKLHYFLISEGFLKNTDKAEVECFLPVIKKLDNTSNVLVLAFGGMLSGIGLPPFEFFNSLKKRNCSCLFFKDFYQCWYQKGLLGLTDDVFETKDMIQRMIEDIAPNQILTIGTSAGGYAAIMFGVLLGVSKVLAFSPQTQVGNRVVQEFGSLDTSNISIDNNKQNVVLDLVKLIEDSSNNIKLPETHIYFGDLNRNDKLHAKRLSQFQNIHLHPIAQEQGHNIAGILKSKNQLDGIIDNFLMTS